MNPRRFQVLSILCAPAIVLTASSRAQESPKGVEQCATLRRVLSYNNTLKQAKRIILLVVSKSGDADAADIKGTQCREQGLFVSSVKESDLNDDLTEMLAPENAVVYVTPGVDHEAVGGFVVRKGFLSISGTPALAESGAVSIAVKRESGELEIVVNMPRLLSEGHMFSSRLLRIARVLR